MRRLLLLFLLLAIVGSAVAQSKPVVVVELFTSEGCSSCPPADALFRRLQAQGVAGADLALLGEHVDYWNHLGWRDAYSSTLFTRRQEDYTGKLNISGAYTPQAVIDGNAELVGNDEQALLSAINRAAKKPKPLNLTIAWNDVAQTAQVTVEGQASGELFVAITEDGVSSTVKAGENGGQTLTHAAVTRRMIDAGPAKNGTAKTVKTALDKKWDPSKLHLIAFVQDMNSGAVLGAAALRLDPGH